MTAPVLVVALSGRALAAAARRCGVPALVLDLFADADTRRLARGWARVDGDLETGFDALSLLAAAEALAPAGSRPPLELVVGAGFEDRPELLTRLARGRRLLGTPPEAVARVKDPFALAALADRLGIRHPEVRRAPPRDPEAWLAKRAGGSGGAHVRMPDGSVHPQTYYQRRVAGAPLSALLLADGRRARVLGCATQWTDPGAGFRFGGVVGPVTPAPALRAELDAAVAAVVAEIGLVGLNAIDFLVDGDRLWLLEVNPRPGASLELFDRGRGSGLFDLHRDACDGRLPDTWQAPVGAAATAVVYARRALEMPAGFRWPRWAADRPPPGTTVPRGAPLCTVRAPGRDPEAARAAVLPRGREILERVEADAGSGRPARAAGRPGLAVHA